MFDARSILDALVRGGGQPQASRPGQGGDIFRDLLGQLGTQDALQRGNPAPNQSQGRSPYAEPDPGSSGPRPGYQAERPDPRGSAGQDAGGGPQRPGGMSLEDLLRSVLGGGQAGTPGRTGQGGPGGGIEDILRDLLGGGSAGMSRMVGDGAGQRGGEGTAGSVLDVLKQILGEATSGVREGAGRLDEMTGASGRAREAIGQATGQSPDELIARLKELVANNRLGAGAALGGLGALILGTETGRALAGSAVRLGGLALIGGLAYRAYQNYQKGLAPLGGKDTARQALAAAPGGSGFEPEAVAHEQAVLYVRAMIAAAAADGRIDPEEQRRILGGLEQAGLDSAAQQFLAAEINNPATVEDLAGAVSTEQEAVQVYTAARIAVDVDTGREHAFLTRLAQALGLDPRLAAQVEAAARRGPA